MVGSVDVGVEVEMSRQIEQRVTVLTKKLTRALLAHIDDASLDPPGAFYPLFIS